MNTSSTTVVTPTITSQHEKICNITFQVLWLGGIVVSILCLLIQLSLFSILRSSRKIDEKILSHITFTRILATSCEYYILYAKTRPRWMVDFVFGLYFMSDFAIVCWMLVFTKHLYDKTVVVFNTLKINVTIATISIWLISSPFGFVAIYLLKYKPNYFVVYCNLFYVVVKFVIQTINSLIYIRIFYVALKRDEDRKVRSIIKTAFVAFLLITTTCVQILVTDIISIISGIERNEMLVKSFCVINSFHAVPLTAIFIMILKGKMRQSISKTVTMRLTELVT